MRSRVVLGMAVLASMLGASAAPALPPGFIEETVISGLDKPVGLRFDQAGRMWIWTQPGRLYFVRPGETTLNQVLDLSDEVSNLNDTGLTGFALDPAFEVNGQVYLFYTVDWEWWITGGAPDPANQDQTQDSFGRLTRYTCTWDTGFTNVACGNRLILIGSQHDNGVVMTSNSHGPGTLQFARDGTLLASVGDGACYTNCGGTPDIGGCRGAVCSDNTAELKGILQLKEQVGAYRSQLIDTYNGKILRLDPSNIDPSLGIAGHPSNPFYDAADPHTPRSKVYALGLRNPHQFTIRPGTGSFDPGDGDPGILFIGDVGWNTWEDMDVCDIPGQNFGWPIFEGMFPAADYPTLLVENRDAPNPLFDGVGCTQEFFHFTDLLVQDTANTPSYPNPCDGGVPIAGDLTFMHRRPRFSYKHFFNTTYVPTFDGSGNAAVIDLNDPASPVAGSSFNGRSPIGGVFYTGSRFPETYRDTYFFCDAFGKGQLSLELGWIRNLIVDADHRPVEVRDIRTGGTDAFPIALALPPDQAALYYVQANSRFFPPNTGEIRRISYDCNGNGVSDFVDVATGTSSDLNGNGYPDECETPGDLNGDGSVNVLDLLLLLTDWGPCLGCAADLNGDGAVDVLDLLEMLTNWG